MPLWRRSAPPDRLVSRPDTVVCGVPARHAFYHGLVSVCVASRRKQAWNRAGGPAAMVGYEIELWLRLTSRRL